MKVEAPHWTLPIIGLDLNDGLGAHQGARHRSHAVSLSQRKARSGRTLQLLDHDPVLVRFVHAPDMFRPKPRDAPQLDVNFRVRRAYRLLEEFILGTLFRHKPHSYMTDQTWQAATSFYSKTTTEETHRQV